MARPKRNGDPTKADTARLVSYSENLVKALEDAGYRLDKRVPILETRYEADRSQDKEAYEKSIDVEDFYEAVIRTPYLADDILYPFELGDVQSKEFEISESKRKEIVEAFEKHYATVKKNIFDPENFNFANVDRAIQRLKESVNKSGNDFLEAARKAGTPFWHLTNSSRGHLYPEGEEALAEAHENLDFLNQNEYKLSPRAAMIGALGVSGIADLDYYQSLSDQGYTYPDSPEIRYDGKVTPSSIARSIGNFGIDLYNRLNMKQEYVDRGDKGKSYEIINPDEMVEKFKGGDTIDSMFSVYPNVKTDHTKVETPWSKEKGQYYKDLGEGFYEDREYDRVQNLDIPPSLFREGITPASIKTYWNEDKQDFIEVYDYDSPEFRKSAGVRGGNIPSDGDDIGTVPTSVRLKKKTQPVRLKKKILPTAKRVPPKPNYQTEGSGFSFTPVFRGDIQQSAYRGRGTTDALSGVSMDFMNPDGTIRRMTTDLSDVPDYITKDPYFERLLNTANEKYFQLEREKGSEGTQQAVKTPEAQMIGRILSGDITIDEAKRQGKYTYASF